VRLPVRRLAVGPALLLALVAGCGGSSDPSAEPSAAPTGAPSTAEAQGAAQVVQASATRTQEAGSARVELTSETVVGDQTISFTGTGAFDAAAKRGTFQLDAPAAGGTIEQRIVDDTIYLTLPQEPGVFYAMPLEDIAGTPLGGSTDPTAGFAALEAVSDDVREVGTETVRDVETTHYTGTFDVAAAIEQAQGTQKTVLQSTLGPLRLDAVPFDVYLDDEGRIRRFTQTIEVPAGPQTNGQAVTSTSTVDVYDFGTQVEVEPPPDDQVKDGSQLLEALTGGAGGGGTAPAPAQPPSPTG
jgi:hypothetical protein